MGGALLVSESDKPNDGWIEIEDGVHIQFPKVLVANDKNTYCSGDYWLIAARMVTGEVKWPKSKGTGRHLPPHGVVYDCAPLALITLGSNDNITSTPSDCRKKLETSVKLT